MYSEKQAAYERHFHNAYEWIYVCEGDVQFEIGEISYDVSKHTLLFINKLEGHQLRITGGCYRRFYMLLTPQQLDRLLDNPLLKSVFISRPANFCHSFDMTGCTEELLPLLDGMLKECEAPGACSQEAMAAMFRLFMIICYRAHSSMFPQVQENAVETVQAVQQHIDRYFSEELKVNKLAEQFFISPSYLSHAFKNWTGLSPMQYIMRSRLAGAKELLLTTRLPVKDVAIRCGFRDTGNFIRCFRENSGQTPLQYRMGKQPGRLSGKMSF